MVALGSQSARVVTHKLHSIVVGVCDVYRSPADPIVHRSRGIELLCPQILKDIFVFTQRNLDSEVMKRREPWVPPVPRLAVSARLPVPAEQADDLRVSFDAIATRMKAIESWSTLTSVKPSVSQ